MSSPAPSAIAATLQANVVRVIRLMSLSMAFRGPPDLTPGGLSQRAGPPVATSSVNAGPRAWHPCPNSLGQTPHLDHACQALGAQVQLWAASVEAPQPSDFQRSPARRSATGGMRT
jgi:hypothetical protein